MKGANMKNLMKILANGDTAQLEGNVVSAWELPSSNHLLLIELRGPLNLTL